MKKWIFPACLIMTVFSVHAQSIQPIRQNDSTAFIDYLAGVKYATIESPKLMVEQALSKNFNVVIAHVLAMQEYLKSMGFQQVVFTEYNPIDRDSLLSLCELVSVKVKYTVQKKNVTNFNIRFEGCDHKIFYEFDKNVKVPLNNVEAYKKSFATFLPEKKPDYDAKKTLTISCLGNSGLSEEAIRIYLENISTDSIEGIYELQHFESPLQIAVVRAGAAYNIVYLAGFRNTIDWPAGEIMGRIRITNRQQFYSADWCGFNKDKFESVPCQSLDCALVFNMGSVQYYFAKTFPVK
jgi:hypothetical protein